MAGSNSVHISSSPTNRVSRGEMSSHDVKCVPLVLPALQVQHAGKQLAAQLPKALDQTRRDFAMRHPSMRTSQRPNLPLKSRDHGQPTLLFRLKTSVDHLSYHPTYLARLILLHLID
ncbi:hypothetical protein Ae201684P_012465 [Aphanomyces euteiches]|nr:hypothetical protein Ae201684P_012465 [Aphanomyces euteiches]